MFPHFNFPLLFLSISLTIGTSIDDTSPCESDTDAESLIISNSSPIHEFQSSSLYDELFESLTNPSDNRFYSNPSSSICRENNTYAVNRHKVTIPITGSNNVSASNSSFDINLSPSKLSDVENDLLETLKSLKNPGDHQSPQNEANIYHINHDIIDLTTVPPLKSPSSNEGVSPYAVSSSSIHQQVSSIYANPASSKPYESYHHNLSSNNISLDNLCQNLSQLHASYDPNCTVNLKTLEGLPDDIDNFIATVTVPPPSTSSIATPSTKEISNSNDYLDSLIIPPPPITSPGYVMEQDEIIARFWKATDDMRKVCSDRDDSSPRLSSRGLYSSSSGDSGYDSIMNTFSNKTSDRPIEWCGTSHENETNKRITHTSYQSGASIDYGEQNNYLPTVQESPMDNLSRGLLTPQTINPLSMQNTLNSHQSPISSELVSLAANIGLAKMNSCDNLYILSRKQENKVNYSS